MMHKNSRLLSKRMLKTFFCFVAFFSLNMSVSAASFAYSSFDWDKFYEENVDYWTDYCKTNSGEVSLDDCLEITLSGKKKYYVKLYKLLAKYERKGYTLNDNYILATTFYYLTPDSFSDIPEEYLRDYIDGSAYNIDDEDIEAYDVDTDEEIKYYLEERDSLKTLIKHMFAYPATCEGKVADPQTDSNGNKVCYQGTLKGNECVGTLDDYKLNYSEYLIAKWDWIGWLFGFKSDIKQECESLGGKLNLTHKKIIHYETYWRFLEESTYFDNKVHLNTRYASVLEKSGHTLIKDMSDEEKEPYKEELQEIRRDIIDEIKSVLEDYGDFAETPDSYVSAGSTYSSLWWPIGSDEVTVENGISFASGNPASLTTANSFGQTTNQETGEVTTHTGIDIINVQDGVTNAIAVKDGVVVKPTSSDTTNCSNTTDEDSCNDGYGNYVVIQHNDGTFTLYAHLYPGSITVNANDSVKQGQVIGKVGSSGSATSAQLHFEVRQGVDSSSAAINPLNYISQENPRSQGITSNDFFTFLHSWENAGGAPENNGNYVVHDDGASIPTVGYGVALKYNVERFRQKGIDVTNLTFGDEIPKDIVDAVEMEEVNAAFNSIRNTLSKSGISLAEYQIEALVSRYYNCGNIRNFPDNYLKYGDTDALYTNYMSKPVTSKGKYMSGLERRREAEWQLFHYQNYQLNA